MVRWVRLDVLPVKHQDLEKVKIKKKKISIAISPMWYSPIQSVASTSSLMSQDMTRFWPRFSVYSRVDAVSEDRLSEVTRSVSLLARVSPIGLLTTETVSTAAVLPLSVRVRRFSGLRVCRRLGLRLRGADSCSRVPTDRLGALWERVLGGSTAVAREGRMLHTWSSPQRSAEQNRTESSCGFLWKRW